jgi:ribosomal protein S18 acetylase RimI-like enzyme
MVDNTLNNSSALYALIKADQVVYATFFATYRTNVWFRPSWLSLREMMLNASDCYWVFSNNTRIAGISVSKNTLGSIFVIPPFTLSVSLISFLKEIVLKISDDKRSIDAYNVLPEHIKAFMDEGFISIGARKCMVRPTEYYTLSAMSKYEFVKPEREYIKEIIDLMVQSYKGGLDQRDLETHTREVEFYFDNNSAEELLDASSIMLEKQSGEMTGICLVSLWEDMPLIYEIAVKPTHRSTGLARYMIQRAITQLEPYHSLIRLFVTVGNTAENLYSSLGFMAGSETSHMKYSLR